MPKFKIYGLDNECYADVEIPVCSYNVDKLEWTEIGRLYKRYAHYIAKDNGIKKVDKNLIPYNTIHKYNSYFYRTKKQQKRRKI